MTTTTIKASLLSNSDSDDSDDDVVPKDVTHKTLLAKQMEKRLFAQNDQDYKDDDNTFPYDEDNAEKASLHNLDDSDSDMSFVVVKPSTTTRLRNAKRISKSTITTLDEQSFDKENTRTFSPKKKTNLTNSHEWSRAMRGLGILGLVVDQLKNMI